MRGTTMTEAVLIGGPADSDVPIDVESVREQVANIGSALAPLMEDEQRLPFVLNQVAVGLGISKTGKVGFILAGAEVTVEASITLVFERPQP